MIGRKKEIERIKHLLYSNRSEFLAVTGRRRVGKTYLVDNILKEHYCFSITGIQNGNLTAQLINFGVKLMEYDGSLEPKIPKNWQQAFLLLKTHLKTLDRGQKHVIFIDELPWIATPKSNFIQMLAHFWNDFLSKEPHFLLVICGSATSWISHKIVNDSGGLHNRITENIHLYPFTLAETQAFLQHKGFQFTQQEVAKIYMTLGGVPFYLENLRQGESFAASIERICFLPYGILYNEYSNLFQALFSNPEVHISILSALSSRQYGMSHSEIMQFMGLKQPTGSYQRAIEDLLVSDFIIETTAFGKKKRGSIYRLVDEFTIFYHRFMKPNRKYTQGLWQQLAETQVYKIWTGYAFETLCHKHIDAIKHSLGIASVYTEIFSLSVPTSDATEGFQIDLLIDRKDNCINLCEIKFYSAPFSITKEEYEKMLALRQRFIDHTGTKKQVFVTYITNHGVAPNAYAREIVDAEVRLADLMNM
jgi:uncharacterized protein